MLGEVCFRGPKFLQLLLGRLSLACIEEMTDNMFIQFFLEELKREGQVFYEFQTGI